ncbi:MAG: hypothetical protein NT120_00660 [Candidatus Aenigmarchaeota archaeon]|nr:hypothetical protein [Candidatus Aenigmarchaeota archaeon]
MEPVEKESELEPEGKRNLLDFLVKCLTGYTVDRTTFTHAHSETIVYASEKEFIYSTRTGEKSVTYFASPWGEERVRELQAELKIA